MSNKSCWKVRKRGATQNMNNRGIVDHFLYLFFVLIKLIFEFQNYLIHRVNLTNHVLFDLKSIYMFYSIN